MIIRQNMNPDTRIQRTDTALSSPVADELVMFDTAHGKYYGMNDIASAIWERLDEPVTVQEVCDSLVAEFDVSPEECRRDVTAFLIRLKEKDLIRVIDS